MALRWQWLMRAQGMDDSFGWLTRAYFVSYTASQVLPTSIGGDAMRVYETARRHPGRTGDVTAIILLERGLGGAGHGAARRDRLRARDRDVRRRRLPLARGAFVLGTLVLVFLFFARSARPLLARGAAAARAGSASSGPLRALYDGVHHFRGHAGLLLGVFVFTTAIQAVRILSIWAAARAVGIDLGPRIYYVMGPLFFLVLLVPFTLNGIAVREAFFVSFLGSVGVAADPAFAAGFLFFLVTTALALPGAAILLWEGIRGAARGRGSSMADAARRRVRRRHLRRAALDRAVPRERRGHRDGRRRQRLVATARSAFVRERFPAVRVIEDENRGLAAGWNRGIAATDGRARARPQRGRLARRRRARATGRGGRPASRRPRLVGPRLLNPDGIAAALGAWLPDASGGSRPSTSTCASSRRARGR